MNNFATSNGETFGLAACEISLRTPGGASGSLDPRPDHVIQVEPVRDYEMNPGDVKFYDVGVVHSPRREAPTKLLRVEGANLDHVVRSRIKRA
jgi:hypothetical protein